MFQEVLRLLQVVRPQNLQVRCFVKVSMIWILGVISFEDSSPSLFN